MNLTIKLILTFLLILINSINVKSQSIDNYNMWYQYIMNAKLTNKTTLTALSQYRSFDLAADGRLFLVNAYLEYQVAPGVEPGAGAMFLILNSYNSKREKVTRYETRPFQQVTLTGNIGRTLVNHRFRVEERFLSNPDEFKVRLRYLLSMRIPFGKLGKYYGIVKNEIRINATKTDIFDSNRITAGLGIKLSKASAIEVAYINQLGNQRTDNYAYVGFRNTFDWRKKEQ
ncbi:DUF2490 domain-containing protein [Chryseobacterium lactis]|uniref:DUF2490 domain-containing protein n=1 Tax=Chryseobacterium lactis TaxID=1241981 RepID=A0A3G6RL96_CHRLC|nr:DUF2490 domain-containing protein [Chryseobacterium lactis]AZA80730.1 DUF2490 domain-containing protein [Chryseobacterium lactis]AZB05732.1 DUF2490 domain-containing protein [Chryseobacterium lactis]PNW13549.1 DUF2490 domain-containing protein [Chryseobacterium lactis]